MSRFAVFAAAFLASVAAAPAPAITIEQAMADPAWIGAPVERAYWSIDGKALYYHVKRSDSSIRDLYRIDPAGGNGTLVDPAAMADSDGAEAVFDAGRTRAAFARNGDIFIREVASGRLIQVTRTPETEASPQFSADGRALQYRAGNDWFSYDLARGVAGPVAQLKTGTDPADKKPDELAALQLRLFSTLREIKDDRDARRAHAEQFTSGDPTRAPLPLYLGEDATIVDTSLSPDARWLIGVTSPKGYDGGRIGKLQRFVTESGYEEQEDERTRVGRNDPAPHALWLADLGTRTVRKLALDDLPGIKDDPLAAVREENRAAHAYPADAAEPAAKPHKRGGRTTAADGDKIRPVQVPEAGHAIDWTRDGSQVALQLRAIDNKDRWIVTVAFGDGKLVTQHRLTDPAWINWNYNEFGWLPDNRTLWYLSEESGWSQLYTRTLGAKARALTQGRFEVSNPQPSADGRWFYLRANPDAPYSYDAYRVASAGGAMQRITRIRGMEQFALSPDGQSLLLLQSSPYVPAQLAVVPADGSAAPRQLTDTRTAQYRALQWPQLEIVAVPSTHTAQPIYAKFYKPADFDPAKRYPAVLFVHGAGYLQNTDYYWPNYFREQFFHNLLTEQGYVVLDMDYRASEGYGRDWRTAIYRNMGHPELEDLLDGKAWLVKNHSVDPQRVGMYGGSYGGFMTLMALLRAPGEFAAGAALRPVTDWTQYNHEYTSNILNDPQVDPMAYARSSPIEFAAGLADPLLICHGMNDDNVLFADSVRLFQRFVELHKDNFELAPYPMERHGFKHADSWLDEYKRIHKLFEAHLKP